ncbi:MAG: ATP-binding protein, partial [Chloroflexota bacterium]
AWAVREGVTNVIRHSRAQRCAISLIQHGDRLELEVLDDGCGQPSGSGARGSGLSGLAERLAAVGGAAAAQPLAGSGFRLMAWLPLGAEAAAEKEQPAVAGSERV